MPGMIPEQLGLAKKSDSSTPNSFWALFDGQVSKYRNPKNRSRLWNIISSVPRFVFNWLRTYEQRWKTILAFILLIAILGSIFAFNSKRSEAASFTFTQTDWSGGQSGLSAAHPTDESGWTNYSAKTNADTTTTPGSVKTASSTTNFSEGFTTTTYKDAGNTTATWDTSGHKLSMGVDTYTDLTSALISGTSHCNVPVVDYIHHYLYYSCDTNGDGKYVNYFKYDIGAGTKSHVASMETFTNGIFATGGKFDQATYDPINDAVYLTSSSNLAANFYRYNNSNNTTTDLSSKINTGFGVNVWGESAGYNSAQKVIYFSGLAQSNTDYIGYYNPANDTFTNITSSLPPLGGIAAALSDQAFDSARGYLYLGTNAHFGIYNYVNNTYTDKTSRISGINDYGGAVYDLNTDRVYVGFASGSAIYNPNTDTSVATSVPNSHFGGYALLGKVWADGSSARKIDLATNTTTNISGNFPGGDFGVGNGAVDTYANTLYNFSNFGTAATRVDVPTSSVGQSSNINSGGSNVGSVTLTKTDNTGSDQYNEIGTMVPSNAAVGLVMDVPSHTVFFGNGNGIGGGNFYKYDVNSAVRTTIDTSPYNFSAVTAMGYDPANRIVYVGQDHGRLLKYDVVNQTSTNLDSVITAIGNNFLTGLIYNPSNGYIYISASGGNLGYYNPSNNSYTSLNSNIPSYSGSAVYADFVDTGRNILWIQNGSLGAGGTYNYNTNTYSDKGVAIAGGNAANIFLHAAFDTVNDRYILGSSGFVYNPNTNTAFALGCGSGNGSMTFVYDGIAYIGGNAGSCRYVVATNTLTSISGPAVFFANAAAVDTSTKIIYGHNGTNAYKITRGTVTYYVSNDGGSVWNQVTPGQAFNFGSLNNDLRWKAVLTTNASVSSVGLSYTAYATYADLTSSPYNTGDSGNLVAKVAWTSTGETSNEVVKLQIRTSPDGAAWSGWCGYSDVGSSCDGTNYFTTANNNSAIPNSNPVRSGGDDKWFEYKLTLLSSGTATASFNDITISYVVNVSPSFNTTNGLTASQITDQNDSNYNKVNITYSIRDQDTATGTTTPGFITPSFEYNIGSGWVAIPGGNLSANATANKAVDEVNYTSYTAYWDAKTQIPNNYLTTAQIRVTLNDNEAANNTSQQTSSNFTLDTKSPVVTFKIDGSLNKITLTGTDDTNLQYRISNNVDLSSDGLNGTSGQWVDAGGNSININPSWNFAAVPNHTTVYVQVRDTSGNVTALTAVAPNAPPNGIIQDISNPDTDAWALFTSWDVYTATNGATFSKYEVYRSTDGSSYSLLATLTDVNQNYYADFGLTQGNLYFYKTRTVDTDTDKSGYSTVVSKTVDGHGVDNSAPQISNVQVTDTQSTSATITWTTDALSDSRVDYSIAPAITFAQGQSVSSFVLQHSVTLTNLTPNTNYLFRVKSSNAAGSTATDDNDGQGYALNTSSGPVISGVTESAINANSATIFWTTNIDSNSHVTYSTNSDLSSPTTLGSDTLVGGSAPYQHSVDLTALSGGTTYYFYVESKDGSNNNTKDNNGGSYYTFVTTTDNVPPVISNLSTPVIAPTAIAVVWETDELATTQLEYGTVSGTYTNTTLIDTTPTIFHIVSISGLTEDQTYYFRAHSMDSASNEAISDEGSAKTGKTTIIVQNVSSGGGGGSTFTPDTTPPTISSVAVSDITAFGATVSFTTDEDSIGLASYGQDSTKLAQTGGNPTFSKDHSITLTGLKMGTKYFVQVTATDKSGNTATADTKDFTTTFLSQNGIKLSDAYQYQQQIDDAIESALPSLVAPFIESPVVSNITDTSATLTWHTNIKAYGAVSYATDQNYNATQVNPYTTDVSDLDTKDISHTINLANLSPDTVYHFAVKAYTLPQVVGATKDQTFVTKALNIKAQISGIGNTSFNVSWHTSEPTTSVVTYRNIKTGETAEKSLDEKTQSHDIKVDNLLPATGYEVSVYGINARGNKVSTVDAVKVTTSQDQKAPEILSLKIDTALIPGRSDRTQTIVSWKSDEPSTSTVMYEEGAGIAGSDTKPLANKVEITNSFVLDHAVVLSTLKPGGLYRIQVGSTDAAGNVTLLPIKTIVVPRQSESILDVIFKNFEDTFKFLKTK